MVPKNAMVVPPSPPLPLALVLRTSNNTTLSHEGARNKRFHRTAAGSNGLLRAAGSGKAAAARSSSSGGGGEGEKQIEFEALKAPAC